MYAIVNEEFTNDSSTNTEESSADTEEPSTDTEESSTDSKEKSDVNIGSDANTATLSWSDTTLTVTGKGDLSKISITDGETNKKLAEKLADYIGTGDNACKKVVFKTADGETTLAKINNAIVRSLISTPISTLNLQNVSLDSIKTPFPKAASSDWTLDQNATFIQDGSSSSTANSTLKVLYTPQVTGCSALQPYTFNKMSGLVELHLSEGIDTLKSLSLQVESNGFGTKLTTLTFPNSLKVAKKEACKGLAKIEVFTFPAVMAEIDSAAFTGTKPRDVYFLGTDAPKVAKWAWGSDAYIANNALTDSVEDGESGHTVNVNMRKGVACRNNFKAQSGWQAMLHYPAACSKAQAARYTDLTRNYRRINKGDSGDEITQGTGDKAAYTYYTPGKETSELKGNDGTTTNAAVKSFQSGDETTGGFTYDHSHSYTGGFYDMYVGEQYLWPSMPMAYRATVVAQNCKLWNGTSSIGDGIRAAATQDKESTSSTTAKEENEGETSTTGFQGDGSEYIGLHQFVFAKGDVTQKKTDEWDMSKYADGEWHTICLPLNITKAQMKEIFGKNSEGNYDHIRLCKFSKVDRISEGANKHLKLFFNDEKFNSASNDNDIVLEAHVSYMIKAEKKNAVDNNTIVLKNYEIVAGNPIPTNVTVNESETTPAVASDDADDNGVSTQSNYQYYFIGTYLTNIKMPQYCYFFSAKKKLFRFQGGTTGKWNPYTSIVEAPEGVKDDKLYFGGSESTSQSKLFTALEEDDNETTGIDKVTIEVDGEVVYTNDNVYNLNGQLVSTRGLNGLPKGLYIQNGKKYIVK